MMKGAVIMRYISHYEEYPIYEPAEGGYYYPGNQLVASERKSKRQCRKDFEKIWQECLEETISFPIHETNEQSLLPYMNKNCDIWLGRYNKRRGKLIKFISAFEILIVCTIKFPPIFPSKCEFLTLPYTVHNFSSML